MSKVTAALVRVSRSLRHRVDGWSQPVLTPDDQRRFTAEHSGGSSGPGGG